MGSILADSKNRKFLGIVFDLDDTLYPQESYKRSGFAAVAKWLSTNYDFSASAIMTELEKILRQLREEELERMLAMLEARFRKMLLMQQAVYDDAPYIPVESVSTRPSGRTRHTVPPKSAT